MRFARLPARPAVASLVTVAVSVGVVVLITQLGVRPVSDPSPWLHLRIGEYLSEGGRFAGPDPFSQSVVRSYVPTQWLPSVAAYELYAVVGLPAVAWLRAVCLLGLFLVLVLTVRRGLPGVVGVVLAGGVTLVSLPTMTERPQAFGMVLLAVSVLGWWSSLQDGRPRWWLVPLAWLFAASHGLWSIALGVGLLVCLGRALDGADRRAVGRLVLVVAGQLVVTALTPLGPPLLLTPLTVGANGREFVLEWQPGTLASVTVVGVLLMVAVTIGLALRSRTAMPWSRLLVLGTALTLTFATIRTGAPAAILLAPLLAEALGRTIRPRSMLSGHALPVVVTAVLVSAIIAFPLALARSVSSVGVPTRLAPQLLALPAGTPVLAQTDVSGWVMWAAPNVSPVVDIRNEAYTPQQLRDYVRTYQAREGWEALIDTAHVQFALVEKTSALRGALVDVRGWHVLGADGTYVLLGEGA